MNSISRRIISDRMRRGDRRGRDYERHDYEGRDYRGHMEYRGEIEHDGRREVYDSVRHGADRREYGEKYNDDHRRDYRKDYKEDESHRDYGEEKEMRLARSDMKRWKSALKNGDGTVGEHFTADQMHEVSRQIGADFDEYDEADLCMTANMLYSDLCEALHSFIPREKEAMVYAKMAKFWLEDKDGPRGSEKLALYYYCIVDDE